MSSSPWALWRRSFLALTQSLPASVSNHDNRFSQTVESAFFFSRCAKILLVHWERLDAFLCDCV